MRLLKGLHSLIVFLARRPYQVAQVHIEKFVYRSKFVRTIAGYE